MKFVYLLIGFIACNNLMAKNKINKTDDQLKMNIPGRSVTLNSFHTNTSLAVLPGYVYTSEWPSLGVYEKLDLLEEWYALALVANVDQSPTSSEIDIYELLVCNADKPVYPNIYDYNAWGGAAEVTLNMNRLEQVKDLGFLENSIYHADMILTTRVNKQVETTGQMEHTWVSTGEKDAWNNVVERMPYLSSGFYCSAVGSVAKWILEHPEIHNQIAPFDSEIPLSGFGNTYYERAVFYLEQLLQVYEAWEREGFWWEFDTVNKCGSWIQNYETYRDTLEGYKAAYPNGFDVSKFLNVVPYSMGTKPERQLFKAWNRQFHMNWGYLVTADALMLLDSAKYAGFNERAMEVSTKVLNFWRGLRVEVTEPAPIGKKYLWGYKPVDDVPNRTEDNTHLWMDKRALELHMEHGLFSAEELAIMPASFTHNRYDFYNFLPYAHMHKDYFYDENGNPYDPGKTHSNADADGPEAGTWMGEYANDEQLQFFAAKCLEVTSERLRLLRNDINAFSLGGDDMVTTMGMLFELHEAKVARQLLNKPDDPSNSPPVVEPINNITVSHLAEIGDSVFTISASEADNGQNLFYWIIGGNDGYKFKIDMYSGEITLREKLDSTIQDSYKLLVEVTDNGAPFKSAVIEIPLNVSSVVTTGTSMNKSTYNNILIYPNPANDILNIEVNGIAQGKISVLTPSGITKANKNIQNTNKVIFNTSNWDRGLYFVHISDKNKGTKTNRKVVIL